MGIWGSKLSTDSGSAERETAAGAAEKKYSSREPTEQKGGDSDGCEPFLDEDKSGSSIYEEHEIQCVESSSKVAITHVITTSTVTTATIKALSTSSVANNDSNHDPKQEFKAALGERDYVISLSSCATSSDKGDGKPACSVDLGTGEDMVGMRIKRQRTGCLVQSGRIADYNSGLKLYKVTFDDGKEEVLEWFDLEPALLHDEHESDIVLAERVGMVQIPYRYPRWRSIYELLAVEEEAPRRERSLAEVLTATASKRKRSSQKSEKRKRVRKS